MACIRNLRAGVVVIEPLKTNKDCMVIQKRSEERKLIYQQECQKDLTDYTQQEKEYYKERRYILYKQTLQELATSHAKEHRSLKKNQAKIPHIKHDEVKILHNIKTNKLSFLIQLFIMIGPACASITKWGDFSSNEEMMKRLTSNLRGHQRFKDMGTDRIKIGTVIVAKPHHRLLKMAQFLATKLSRITADITLGLKYKFFALVIHRKTRYVTQNHIMKNRAMNLTTGIMDILMSKPHDMAAIEQINIITELAVKNVLERFKKRDKAIRIEQQALKSPTPGSSAIEASVTTLKNKAAAKARATTTKNNTDKNSTTTNKPETMKKKSRKRKTQASETTTTTKKKKPETNTNPTPDDKEKERETTPNTADKDKSPSERRRKQIFQPPTEDKRNTSVYNNNHQRQSQHQNIKGSYIVGYNGGYRGKHDDGRINRKAWSNTRVHSPRRSRTDDNRRTNDNRRNSGDRTRNHGERPRNGGERSRDNDERSRDNGERPGDRDRDRRSISRSNESRRSSDYRSSRRHDSSSNR